MTDAENADFGTVLRSDRVKPAVGLVAVMLAAQFVFMLALYQLEALMTSRAQFTTLPEVVDLAAISVVITIAPAAVAVVWWWYHE